MADFDPEFYLARHPDLRAAGIDPVEHWLAFGRHEGRLGSGPPATDQHPGQDSEKEGGLEDFDPEFYLALYPDLKRANVDPLQHWLQHGKAEGRVGKVPPEFTNIDFDPAYYLALYPDLADAGVDPHAHWRAHGRSEGRSGSLDLRMSGSLDDLDATKKTLLIVSHEASRTGAPILALNIVEGLRERFNLVIYLLDGGALAPEFARQSKACFQTSDLGPLNATFAIRKIIAQVQPDAALVNSVVSHGVLPALASASIPIVMLVHEFASYVHPRSTMENVIRCSSRLIFSAPIVQADAVRCFPEWTPTQRCSVLPQGRCLIDAIEPSRDISELYRPASASTRVIIGAGSVSLRKGCDLFVQCAQQIVSRAPNEDIRFIWIGHGYDPAKDMRYSVYIHEQIERSGLRGRIDFIGELASMEEAYEKADMLLLTSRLDPLPNVGIDAICVGLPIVCFESGSGIADILREEGLLELCVAPYMDTSAMADRALRVLGDASINDDLISRLKQIGARRFDMTAYVAAIETLLTASIADGIGEEDDVLTILDSGRFDRDYWWDGNSPAPDLADCVRRFVRAGRAGLARRSPMRNFDLELTAPSNEIGDADAFATYLRRGPPAAASSGDEARPADGAASGDAAPASYSADRWRA